ncbi:hypothetical protein ACFQ6V_13135 [Streptomyces roseifaciens]
MTSQRRNTVNLQPKVMRQLRADPALQALESQLVAAGDARLNPTGTLQIKVACSVDGAETFEPLSLEHRVRRSEIPWLAKDSRNIILTDAPQKQRYLESLRKQGSIWPTDPVEAFVVRHQLNDQAVDFDPRNTLIDRKPHHGPGRGSAMPDQLPNLSGLRPLPEGGPEPAAAQGPLHRGTNAVPSRVRSSPSWAEATPTTLRPRPRASSTAKPPTPPPAPVTASVLPSAKPRMSKACRAVRALRGSVATVADGTLVGADAS